MDLYQLKQGGAGLGAKNIEMLKDVPYSTNYNSVLNATLER